jgi:hypothetical protein
MKRGSDSAFDLICPDLLDCIVEKAASGKSGPSTLEHLARVNKAFRASARRCSQTLKTLVIRKFGKKNWLEAQRACKLLSKEMGMRPNLSRLVVRNGASTADLWAAVSAIQWTSFKGYVHVKGPSWVRDYISSIPVARTSLKTINLNLGSSKVEFRTFNLDSDIRSLVQALPKLEELTLCEARIHVNGPFGSRRPEEQGLEPDADGSYLTSLDILRSSVFRSYCSPRHFMHLKHLSALSSLKFRCWPHDVTWGVSFWPNDSFRWEHLQTLHRVVCTEILRAFMLQSVAKQCPNLCYLALSSSPPNEKFATPAGGRFSILDTIEKCPKLERLFISRGEMVGKAVFQQLVQEIKGSGSAMEGIAEITPARRPRKLLIREFGEDSAAASCLKECRLYQAVLPIGQRFSTRVKRRVIGVHCSPRLVQYFWRCEVWSGMNEDHLAIWAH